jgi:hypothetical protein
MNLLLEQNLQQAVQAPLFSPQEVTFLGAEEILKIVTPILRKRISQTKYDRVVIAEQFLDHFFNQNTTSPLEALGTFTISGSLEKNGGNSCVGLSLDLLSYLPPQVRAFPVGAILSKRYQQLAGPTYSHVTPLIFFQNPRDEMDAGYILLDPSFHIAAPIFITLSSSFSYDMGKKKGVWNFFLQGEEILCQGNARMGEEPWSEEQIQDSIMRYRTDRIDNPTESSAMPMFAIDRSYPIVSRYENGQQRAHINIDLNKHLIHWKVGEEKRPSISFETFEKNLFSQEVADLLLLDKDALNHSVARVIAHVEIFDRLYNEYLELIRHSPFFASLIKCPEDL